MDNKIKKINIALTNRCNLKCIMCDIWKEKPKIDLPLSNINNILNSQFLDSNTDIAFTGGEPFMHGQLSKITDFVLKKFPLSLKTISTNGTHTAKILEYLNEFNKTLPKGFSIHISLDGIALYNAQRGGSPENIFDTIKTVKKQFPATTLKIKFTITPLNYPDLLPTYRFSKKENLDFRIKIVECAENYTNKLESKDFPFSNSSKKQIVKDLLKIYNDKLTTDRTNALFIKNTMMFLLGKTRPHFCKVPKERIFVMPNGDVYSCIHSNKIGNLNENPLDTIWNSKKAAAIREEKEEQCNKCVAYHGITY